MSTRHRISRIGLLWLALGAFGMLIASERAEAQVTFPGACAPNVTITNTTTCFARLRFQTATGILPSIIIPAGGVGALPIPAAGITLTGLWSSGAIMYGIGGPPGTCSCPASSFHTCCVTIGPPGGCCFDVCYDPAACTITLQTAICGTCQL